MAERVLTLRELNRATLARQLLLDRSALAVVDAIEQLVGMQAQQASPPYIGLWTRLHEFRRDDLAHVIADRRVIKATLMRATLHLLSAQDYWLLRKTLQPVFSYAAESIVKQREHVDFDTDDVLRVARDYLVQEPRTFAEISAMLAAYRPDCDIGAMRYTVRTHLPLIQVPINTGWSYPGNPQFTLADTWLGQSAASDANLQLLVFRYLAAFGPATVTDIQTWSGLLKLKDAIDALKPQLRIYRDEQRRELLDLPDMPLPDAETPAPVRFLPEYDNLLLSHHKRTRILNDQYRSLVYLPGLRVRATFLIDGFVHGAWKIEKQKQAATLLIEPFAAITPHQRAALATEAEQLVRFVEADAKTFAVRFADG
jgi:hypothetical protein